MQTGGLAPDCVFPATLFCGYWLSQSYPVMWFREPMWLEEEQKKGLVSMQVSAYGERNRHNSGFKRGCHGSAPILSSTLLILSFFTLSSVDSRVALGSEQTLGSYLNKPIVPLPEILNFRRKVAGCSDTSGGKLLLE